MTVAEGSEWTTLDSAFALAIEASAKACKDGALDMSREARRAVVVSVSPCPKCGAPAGKPCLSKDGPLRVGLHRERWQESSRVAARPKRGKPPDNEVPFYATVEWRRLRYQAFVRYGNACQCCGMGASQGIPLHVDHIRPRSKYPQLEFDLSNLQVLCEDCNLGKGAWDETDWRGEVQS